MSHLSDRLSVNRPLEKLNINNNDNNRNIYMEQNLYRPL